MIVISLIRKGAFKRLSLSTNKGDYLAILQIFETTDDVVNYQVGELDKNFNAKDLYLPDMVGFSKWKPVEYTVDK